MCDHSHWLNMGCVLEITATIWLVTNSYIILWVEACFTYGVLLVLYFMLYFGTNVWVDMLTDGPDGGVGEEAPTYQIEHLATFTVAKENGIVYPSDGMRRLLQLEKSNGIWSQKMQLRLDVSWVLIMDYETGVRCVFYSSTIIYFNKWMYYLWLTCSLQ